MAVTVKASSLDPHLNRMIQKAVAYQQDFFELLPDWTVYKRDDTKFLRQNVGYAIFGPPLFEKNSNSNDILNYKTDNITDDTVISDLVHYGSNASKMINLIVDKICTHGSIPGEDTIKCGIIYLILIDNNSSVQRGKDKDKELIAMPFFKILKYNGNGNVSTQKSKGIKNMYETWYIDIKGRVYKDWEDFLQRNDLPQCIIVYPKDGYYQPDPWLNIAPNYSCVWVVAQDSIACCQRAKVVKTINYTVNTIASGATIGLGIASFFTPVGPIMAGAGLVTTGLSGLWTIGNCSAHLYDRAIHDESISPLERSALSSWLGIAGSTVGLIAGGGNILLKRAAMSGTDVGIVAKTLYNGTLIGSISINLIGVFHQGFNIYKKYKEQETVDMLDVVCFGTHLLFFASNVVDIKFANEIIESTQGQILKDFEANLRDNNQRIRYNSVRDRAAATSATKIEQNAVIIRHINKFGMSNISGMPSVNNYLQSSSNILTVQNYILKVNGIPLIDPIAFVANFAKSYLRNITNTSGDRSNSPFADQSQMLMKVLEHLLGDLYTSKDCPTKEHLPTIPDFKVIINELKNVKRAENILPFLFTNALTLVKMLHDPKYLVEGCRFFWDYVKSNMQEAGFPIYSNYDNNICNTAIRHLRAILVALFDALDTSVNRFLNAIHQYINLCGRQILSNSEV